ncbi:hypothetical protein QEG98_23030 [Myxococcus sp. MxC21-1]|nr:hypothetical protein QEG98_23030 [Myxococcus sp. MxC21-1]
MPRGPLPRAAGRHVRIPGTPRQHAEGARAPHRSGEIEAALLTHPDIREAGVIATGSGLEARLVAFVVSGTSKPPPCSR